MGTRIVTAPALLFATLYNRLHAIQEALEAGGWGVVACQRPEEALEHLRHTPVAAVFCDEYLRGASAAGFLAWSRRLAPERPFYLFSLQPDRARVAGPHDPDEVLPFPPDPATLPRPDGAAGRTAAAGATASGAAAPEATPLQGERALLPLGSLLDMMGMARQSAWIELDGATRGVVALQDGVLRHVETSDGVTGIRALAQLLAAEEGGIRVEPYRAPRRSTLSVSAATALTEATKRIDELARDRALVQAVARALPEVRGVAAGYPLDHTPSAGYGDAAETFRLATALLDAHRAVVGAVTHLSSESEAGAVALVRYGEQNVLAATAASGKSLRLLAALAQSLRVPDTQR